MTVEDWYELLRNVPVERYEQHSVIVQEEEANDTFYYVVGGIAMVERANVQLAFLGMGDFFGEISTALGHRKATSSVVAQRSLTLRALHKHELRKRLWENPLLGKRFFRSVAVRLAHLSDALPMARVIGQQVSVKSMNERALSFLYKKKLHFHLCFHVQQ